MQLIKQLDQILLNLAWSLWTEVGVAGVKRHHQKVLILLEELVIFTTALADTDPRLRDESLDWCSQFHRFISISRLKFLIKKDFEELVKEPFSKYAATLNNISNEKWPVFIENNNTLPMKIRLSGKSILRPHASAALLNIRARSIFGTCARADLVTYFLVHPNLDFSIAEVAEIGYSKRNLAEVLDDLHFGNLFSKFMVRNQQRYRMNTNNKLFKVLEPIPEYAPWYLIFKVLLSLRGCLKRTKDYAESTKVVEIRNCLEMLENPLQRLGLTPPLFQNNFQAYLELFSKWILAWATQLAEGKISEQV
jgi:hypothetical protein